MCIGFLKYYVCIIVINTNLILNVNIYIYLVMNFVLKILNHVIKSSSNIIVRLIYNVIHFFTNI